MNICEKPGCGKEIVIRGIFTIVHDVLKEASVEDPVPIVNLELTCKLISTLCSNHLTELQGEEISKMVCSVPFSSSLQRYRKMERLLKAIRNITPLIDIEDNIIDHMDRIWWELSNEERKLLNSEGPQC